MSVDTATPTAQVPEHARATVRPDKAAAVAELAEAFRTSGAAVLTEYRGLSVKQVTALRVALGTGTTYSVVKNTLTKLAAAEAGLAGLEALLSGPTAVAFISGEPVEAAKTLRDYAKANPALVVKGGVLDGKQLTADEIRKLADLESREVLLAKLAGAMKASLTQAVYLFSAPLAQVARLAAALQDKATEDPSILRGGAGTPVATEAAADVPTEAAADVPTEAAAEAAEAAEAPADVPTEAAADVPTEAAQDNTVAPVATTPEEGTPEATAAEGITPAETDADSTPPDSSPPDSTPETA